MTVSIVAKCYALLRSDPTGPHVRAPCLRLRRHRGIQRGSVQEGSLTVERGAAAGTRVGLNLMHADSECGHRSRGPLYTDPPRYSRETPHRARAPSREWRLQHGWWRALASTLAEVS